MTTNESTAISNALKNIISVEPEYLLLDNEDSAKELSQVFLDGGGNGSITGPYLQAVQNLPKRIWYVQK